MDSYLVALSGYKVARKWVIYSSRPQPLYSNKRLKNKGCMSSQLIFVHGAPNLLASNVLTLSLHLAGYWREWLRRKPHHLSTSRKRLSSARVSSSAKEAFIRIWPFIPRTARGAKIDLIKATFSSYGDKFEVVTVNDVAVHNLSDHLEGVDAVIHAAAPLPGKGDPKALLNVRSLSSKSL